MKSGSNVPGSSASEYLVYSYKRVLWERLTTSIRWHLVWKYFCTHFVSLCCYNPFITIFTVVITHRGSFILYLMPYTLYDKTNKMSCAPSEVSDQPGHPPSLITVFAVWRTKHLLMRTAKTLIRLRGCSGWSESSLGAHAMLLVLSCGGGSFSF